VLYCYIRRYFFSAKDYIFPIFCLGCDKEGVWLCEDCETKIDTGGVFCCPVCHKNTDYGFCCESCVKEFNLDAEVAITLYQEASLIGKIIEALKYQYAEEVKIVFASLIKKFIAKHPEFFKEIDAIIPVPLHKKRFAERGYNQAEIIAKILARELNLPVSHGLERYRPTRQQAKLRREERLVNLKDAFRLLVGVELAGKKVLLIDDVYTTGSTMSECAGALKKAGVAQVWGFSVARG
jgi:ComF family protein